MYTILLTHWGRVTHICYGNLTIIGPDNGLSPGRRQAIIWTKVGILLIEPLGTNISEILVEIITFSIKKMHLKMSSGNWRPFCLGLNELSFVLLWLNHPSFHRHGHVDILTKFPSVTATEIVILTTFGAISDDNWQNDNIPVSVFYTLVIHLSICLDCSTVK